MLICRSISKGQPVSHCRGDGPEHQQRLRQNLKAVCPTLSTAQSPISDHRERHVMVSVDDYTVSRTVANASVNRVQLYGAHLRGCLSLSSEFNALREFIRNNIGDAAGVYRDAEALMPSGIFTGAGGPTATYLTIDRKAAGSHPHRATRSVQIASQYRIPL